MQQGQDRFSSRVGFNQVQFHMLRFSTEGDDWLLFCSFGSVAYGRMFHLFLQVCGPSSASEDVALEGEPGPDHASGSQTASDLAEPWLFLRSPRTNLQCRFGRRAQDIGCYPNRRDAHTARVLLVCFALHAVSTCKDVGLSHCSGMSVGIWKALAAWRVVGFGFWSAG